MSSTVIRGSEPGTTKRQYDIIVLIQRRDTVVGDKHSRIADNLCELSAPITTTRTPRSFEFKLQVGKRSWKLTTSTIHSMQIHPRFLSLINLGASPARTYNLVQSLPRRCDAFLKLIGKHWPGASYITEEWGKMLTCYRRIFSKAQTSKQGSRNASRRAQWTYH